MTTMTKAARAEQEEAREVLREILKPGDTVYTVLRHVSRSGMMRAIDAYVIEDDSPRWISTYAARAAGYKYSRKYEAIEMGGCGMDMGFALVYGLSRALWPDGFGCIGQECPSNDHSNSDRDYTVNLGRGIHANHWHQSGGYALRQRWM